MGSPVGTAAPAIASAPDRSNGAVPPDQLPVPASPHVRLPLRLAATPRLRHMTREPCAFAAAKAPFPNDVICR